MTERKVDLHIHTCYSDGAYTPSDIVSGYKKRGYDIIAVTDHDTVSGVPEAIEKGKEEGITVVPGIEFSTCYPNDIEIHMLGYGIDTENRELKEELTIIREARRIRNEKLIAYFREQGYDISYEDLLEGKKGDYIGKPDFGRGMARKGYIKEPRDIFKPGEFLESPEAKKIKKVKIETKRAIELINRAGGVAVIAHPMKIKNIGEKGSPEFWGNLKGIIERLKWEGLSGIECYHSDHTLSEAEVLSELAKGMGLIVTIGSDFHGEDFKKRTGLSEELENIRIEDFYIDKILLKM